MKKIFFMGILCAVLFACFPKTATTKIDDGFYLVEKLCEPNEECRAENTKQLLIPFNDLFNPREAKQVIIDISDHVPLELQKDPDKENLPDNKTALSITLTREASGKLKNFTASRIMRQVVIVLNGEAITMHKIRDTITGPGMQITRCDDKACEYLNVRLKENVKK